MNEEGENVLLCHARGEEKEGGGLYFLPETLFLAPSLLLSVYSPTHGEAKFSRRRGRNVMLEPKIDTNWWSGGGRTLARGAASLAWTKRGGDKRFGQSCISARLCSQRTLTSQNTLSV